MKTIIPLLLLMIAANVSAQLEVIVYPLSPYVEEGKKITILISISNVGSNSVAIPPGLMDSNGYVHPNARLSLDLNIYKLIKNIPSKANPYPGGIGGSHPFPDMELIENALKVNTQEKVRKKIYGNHYLAPHETETYNLSWNWIDPYSDAEITGPAIYRVDIRFPDFDISIPSFLLYRNQ